MKSNDLIKILKKFGNLEVYILIAKDDFIIQERAILTAAKLTDKDTQKERIFIFGADSLEAAERFRVMANKNYNQNKKGEE